MTDRRSRPPAPRSSRTRVKNSASNYGAQGTFNAPVTIFHPPASGRASEFNPPDVPPWAGVLGVVFILILVAGIGAAIWFGRGLIFPGTAAVQIDAEVIGIERGASQFEIRLHNQSTNHSYDVTLAALSISDDRGNVYDLDGLAMRQDSVVYRTILSGMEVGLDVVLDEPIAGDASTVTFVLDRILANKAGSRFADHPPAITWTVDVP